MDHAGYRGSIRTYYRGPPWLLKNQPYPIAMFAGGLLTVFSASVAYQHGSRAERRTLPDFAAALYLMAKGSGYQAAKGKDSVDDLDMPAVVTGMDIDNLQSIRDDKVRERIIDVLTHPSEFYGIDKPEL